MPLGVQPSAFGGFGTHAPGTTIQSVISRWHLRRETCTTSMIPLIIFVFGEFSSPVMGKVFNFGICLAKFQGENSQQVRKGKGEQGLDVKFTTVQALHDTSVFQTVLALSFSLRLTWLWLFALLFGSLVLLPAFLQGFISTSGWTLFLTLRLTRDCIFFPGKEHAANSRSASSSLCKNGLF